MSQLDNNVKYISAYLSLLLWTMLLLEESESHCCSGVMQERSSKYTIKQHEMIPSRAEMQITCPYWKEQLMRTSGKLQLEEGISEPGLDSIRKDQEKNFLNERAKCTKAWMCQAHFGSRRNLTGLEEWRQVSTRLRRPWLDAKTYGFMLKAGEAFRWYN